MTNRHKKHLSAGVSNKHGRERNSRVRLESEHKALVEPQLEVVSNSHVPEPTVEPAAVTPKERKSTLPYSMQMAFLSRQLDEQRRDAI